MTERAPQTISVIMPAFNAAPYLAASLAPLMALHSAGQVAQVIVVDDCSTDMTAKIARMAGAVVVRTTENLGPAAARNLGAGSSTSATLWFVDADVVAHSDAPSHIRRALADPEFVAVFGSYDDSPAGLGTLSRYKNLVHRFHHLSAGPEASTFWAGCGAVRADVFERSGGFDALAYPNSSIEDIEFGYRLRRLGRIRIEPALQGTHLKHWTLREVLKADIFRRALPWSRLIATREGLNDILNISRKERYRALIAIAMGISAIACVARPQALPLVAVLFILAIACNFALFRYLWQRGGAGFALFGLAYHQIYYIYSSLTFAYCVVEAMVTARKKPPMGTVER